MTSGPQETKKPNNLLRALIALGVIGGLFVFWQMTHQPAGTETPWGNTGVERPETFYKVTFSGSGEGASSNEERMGGDYNVTWTLGNDCYYSFTLDGERRERVGTSDVAGTGSTTLYGVNPGTYHLAVITGPAGSCDWSVEFAPR